MGDGGGSLEGNVVVGGSGSGILAGGSTRGSILGSPSAATQKTHVARNDLGNVPLVTVLVVVLAGTDGALDEYLPALGQVLPAGLSLFAPHDDIVPFGAFLLVPVLIRPTLRRRQREFRHRPSVRGKPHLGILAQIADENDFVDH